MFLRGLSIPEFENDTANYARENYMRDTLLEHIRNVTTQNQNFLFEGHVEKIGSSWDGSKLRQVDEVDLLYVLSQTQVEIVEMDNTFSVKWGDKVCKPRELVEDFADSLERVLSDSPPKNLQHGGYAAPEFSGVRLCGPAVTVLYQSKGDEASEKHGKGTHISVDITLAVPCHV